MSKMSPFFKGQGFRLAAIGVGVVVGIGAVVIVQTVVIGEPISGGFLIGVGIALVVALAAAAIGILLGRRAFGDRLEIALRTAGETKWKHGRIDAAPGHMQFRRYRWQLRFISGDQVDYVVTHVGPDSGRRPSKKQLWSVNSMLHVIEVETDQGTLELALQAHQVDDIRSQLAPAAN